MASDYHADVIQQL